MYVDKIIINIVILLSRTRELPTFSEARITLKSRVMMLFDVFSELILSSSTSRGPYLCFGSSSSGQYGWHVW